MQSKLPAAVSILATISLALGILIVPGTAAGVQAAAPSECCITDPNNGFSWG